MKKLILTIKTHFLLLVLLTFAINLQSQSALGDEGDDANVYLGVSPYVLPKDGIEINLQNGLNSFWLEVNEFLPDFSTTRVANRYRTTQLQHILRVQYGFSQNRRWDLGAEIRYAHVRLDDEARSSPFRVLEGDTPSGETNRGLSHAGIRLRATPVGNVPELTLNANVLFPVASNDELKRDLLAQRTQIGLGLNYFHQLNPATFAFLSGEWRTHFKNDDENLNTLHQPTASAYLVFDLTNNRKWFIFPGMSYTPTLQKLRNGDLGKINQVLFGSAGLLYQPGPAFSVTLNVNYPFILETENVLINWVRESFTGVSLGFRVML